MALTKIQTAALITIIVVAAVAGSAAYFLWSRSAQSAEAIRIGICADIDNTIGKGILRAAILAAEEVNSEGGVLGRNITIVAQDDDDESSQDVNIMVNALTRLLTIDKADFIITAVPSPQGFFSQIEICRQNKKIMFTTAATLDEYTQQVLDEYEQYKYFFKFFAPNGTAIAKSLVEDVAAICKYGNFTKIAFLYQDVSSYKQMVAILNSSFPSRGFEIVNSVAVPPTTTDFTSHLAVIEASGAEILVPLIFTRASVPFVKECYDRQSPFVVAGILTGCGDPEFWEATSGKCEYVSVRGPPFIAGYNLTSKCAQTREAYIRRWGAPIPTAHATATYDGIRYILPEAIKRAGTIDTEAVIKALEKTDVETSLAKHFIYTSSHDLMIGKVGSASQPEQHLLYGILQWQANKTLVTVVPETVLKETGATYKFPPWQGQWTK